PAGIALRAEVAFYPAALPLRAVLVSRTGEPRPVGRFPGAPPVGGAPRGFAAAPPAHPRPGRAARAGRGVRPGREGHAWSLADAAGARLPLAPGAGGLVLLALSGGHRIDVFGEWDGRALTPLGAWADSAFSAVEATA